jgi:E3 ubiquitin-protein ligase HECTD2
VDQCITSYLLARLQHDDGDTSGSASNSPVFEIKQAGREHSFDKDDPILQQPLATAPIHLSGRPVDQVDERSHSKWNRPHEMNRINSAPYSTSSPGSFFTSQKEEQDRSRSRSRSKGPQRDISHAGPSGAYSGRKDNDDRNQQQRADIVRTMFKPLQEYIITSFGSFECINTSFSTMRPTLTPRTTSEGNNRRHLHSQHHHRRSQTAETMSEVDAKTLLLGDFAENGSWWTGERTNFKSPERSPHRHTDSLQDDLVTVKSPRLDWASMNEWYYVVLNAGRLWRRRLDEIIGSDPQVPLLSEQDLQDTEDQIIEAQFHVQRVLLKAVESLLKRPSRPLKEPSDIRFLLFMLANPLLYPLPGIPRPKERSPTRSRDRKPSKTLLSVLTENRQPPFPNYPNTNRGSSGQHSGIIKRILGLLSNVPNECHHHLVSWFAKYSDGQFQRTTDLIGSFVTYRLTRQHGKKREIDRDPTAGLVPNMGSRNTSAALHAALGVASQTPKKNDGKAEPVVYHDDWQIKAAARVMALFFAANNSGLARRGELRPSPPLETGHSAGLAARERAHIHGQIIPTSDFYNTLLDYSDLIADFEAWEGRRGKFAFCQYPFFLSIWAKIQIMEHDARRQMEVKAREAFFDSIMTHKNVNQYLILRIRRECLVEDSLKGVSEVVGSGGEEIKKGLRIEFKGEEGIDAGGLRKEWFLLLVRDVFNPEHGKVCNEPRYDSC